MGLQIIYPDGEILYVHIFSELFSSELTMIVLGTGTNVPEFV